MPYLRLATNQKIADDKAEALLKLLSAAVAEGTGKPESVVLVELSGGVKMLMAKTADPVCYMDVKGIGLAEATAKKLSASLCEVAERELGVSGKRVYISYTSFSGSMWGFNGGTF